ncbi:MAG: hypothetical protein MK110_15545 [Fuerstiella sp.]|nr:hypothetical protein [Fuerstiella sp.]
MAGKFDPRIDDLVIETRTLWDESVGEELSNEDRRWVSQTIHEHPQLAAKIRYERSHTGFTREITVTLEDIQKLYTVQSRES